ncbi:MAG: Rv0361 family membrane protein [Mycobacterium sp.]
MSNPSGSDPEVDDSDPITEVIDLPNAVESDPSVTGERRYTAPGFDAGSTQIIDRLPDDETQFIDTSGSFAAAHRRRNATPMAIPPRTTGRPSWLIPILLVVAALLAAAVIGVVVVKRAGAAKASQQNAVRSTIQTFDTAVRGGDLATLRSITCGQTRENYAKFDDKSWADASARIIAAKQYPVVASVDEVVVNGDHAEANVTSYMAFDPSTTSTRSFDLQFRDDQWKICQSG